MLLHLPIVIMATLSPIAVSDSVPQFDITRECRFEGGSTTTFDRCSRDETTALFQLRAKWAQFGSADQKICMSETTIGGFASYVELLTCLEMARDAASPNRYPNDARVKSESQPAQPGRPNLTVAEGHWL
jgi:hypothetical protein